MTKKFQLLLTLIFFTPLISIAQKDTLIKKLDSLERKKDTAGQVNITDPSAYNEATKITFKSYFVLLQSDLKQEFTKPFHMTGKNWRDFGMFSAVLVGLTFADKPVQKFAVQLMNDKPGLEQTSRYITNLGGKYETIALATIAGYGMIFKKRKMVTTTLLATQAYITGSVLENLLKFLTGRTRPNYNEPPAEPVSKFYGPFFKNRDASGTYHHASFPSGHTTVAFAAATVYALEYKNIKLVPVMAYSAATLIGLSRITENKHWLTDVVAGAAIGFLQGKNIVNNYHRYAKLKAPRQNKNSVSFNLQYVNGQVVPGVVYNFK